MKIFRFDNAKIRNDSLVSTKDGFLSGTAVVTRTGVFKYINTDGTIRRELRTPQEVFKQESLDTMKNIPVTLEHPPDFVNSKNADEYIKGYTGEQVTHNDNQVMVNFTITNQDAINAVRGGKRELSLGYEQDLVLTEGNQDGLSFDAKQTNIEYNHLAIVSKARAGRSARINLDGYGEYAVQLTDSNNPSKKGKTMIVKINGVDHDLPEDAAKAVIKQQKKDAEDKAALEAKVASEKARGDSAQEDLHEIKEEQKKVKDAADLKAVVTEATPILGKDFKFDSLDIAGVKRAVVSKMYKSCDSKKMDSEGEVYVNARYDTAIETFAESSKGVAAQRAETAPTMNKDGVPEGEASVDSNYTYRRDGTEIPTGKPDDKVEDARKKYDAVLCHSWKKVGCLEGQRSMDAVYEVIKPLANY